jgi:pimeloyl-ACP methyl ester carboxylesterase
MSTRLKIVVSRVQVPVSPFRLQKPHFIPDYRAGAEWVLSSADHGRLAHPVSKPVSIECIEVNPGGAGVGPPVLFVHGVGHAAWCWRPWQDGLAARGIRSVAMSLRGHGTSGGRLRGATLGAYVADVVSTAESLGAAPVLVGHSMGGIIVQRAVHRTPASGLVLLAPGPAHNGVPFALRFARSHPTSFLQVLAGRAIPFERRDLLSDDVPATDAAAIMAKIAGESALAQYQITMPRRPPRRASCPRLLLGTPDDRVIPVAEIERCAVLQETPVRWFSGLGHDVMLEPRGSDALGMLAQWILELPEAVGPSSRRIP